MAINYIDYQSLPNKNERQKSFIADCRAKKLTQNQSLAKASIFNPESFKNAKIKNNPSL